MALQEWSAKGNFLQHREATRSVSWLVQSLNLHCGAFHDPILALCIKIDALVVESLDVWVTPDEAKSGCTRCRRRWSGRRLTPWERTALQAFRRKVIDGAQPS